MRTLSRQPKDVSGIRLHVCLEGIHSYHLVTVEASSVSAFELEIIGCSVYSTQRGNQESQHLVASVKSDAGFSVNATVIGAYAQLPVKMGDALQYGQGPGVTRVEYGVRFFPFISSIFRIHIKTHHARIQALDVTNSPEIRLLWSQAHLSDEAGRSLPRQVAHSQAGWQESLAWLPTTARPQELILQLPVRASGRAIAKSVLRPMFTWMASMVAIALSAELGSTTVVVASVVGTWSFLLREWADSPRAHQVNILAALLIFHALTAGLWGIALKASPLAAWLLGLGLAIVTIDLFVAAIRFEYAGRLPRRMAIPWASAARTLEKLRARRRRRFQVAGFDHEREPPAIDPPYARRRRLLRRLKRN